MPAPDKVKYPERYAAFIEKQKARKGEKRSEKGRKNIRVAMNKFIKENGTEHIRVAMNKFIKENGTEHIRVAMNKFIKENGTEHIRAAMNKPETRYKVEQTVLNRYGVRNISQVPEIQSKKNLPEVMRRDEVRKNCSEGQKKGYKYRRYFEENRVKEE